MIVRVVVHLILGCLVAVALRGEAVADHMTGRYTMVSKDARTASMAGSVLQLQQSGRNVAGQITGASFRAQLQGESDGGNNARGFITTQGGQRQYFEAAWDQGGIRLTMIMTDGQGRPDYSSSLPLYFAREGGGGTGGFGPPPQPGSGGQPGFPGTQGQPGVGVPPPGQPGFPPPGQPGFPPSQGPPQGQWPPPQGQWPPSQGPPQGQWPPQR